ncbi:glycosyltransferase family 2 protein [Wenyingzhuangia aestuarii]|uniref:glycosyltransferase family 2 protein n=1 Tax=Wenyingzhuangia aestuarii TaxID=1647582 RepID=UPI00143AB230|nr:glycosyltransferase family 2 protein [Wenyingzhuangia aestuarii]NJB83250.1 glycosyltransferase [Wenyingzhuangia aestuarii]
MKVSIITIVYNNEASIETTIKSVASQTYQDIEYIVIDGGSTDNTNTIINNHKDKIDYYVSEPDKGLYNALNKGIRAATGDVIGILHSDDLFYSKNTIKNIANAFAESKADVVYANGMYVDKEDISQVKRIYKAKKHKKRYLNFGWIPLHTTIYVKKEIFKTYGLYDESYRIASDYEISLRWFQEDSIKKYFLNEWVVKMRLGGKSTTAKLQKLKSTEDLKIIHQKKLLGQLTLFFKILRKVPQYIIPKFKNYQ